MNFAAKSILSLFLFVIILGSCSSSDSGGDSQAEHNDQQTSELVNPASENCIKKGGKLIIEKRGDGGEYGLCLFEDNMQCEEWAMLRGECPVGGIRITGYVTPAAKYCAITGGDYTITANSNMENEQGTCSFKNGKMCDVWQYYDSKCSPDS